MRGTRILLAVSATVLIVGFTAWVQGEDGIFSELWIAIFPPLTIAAGVAGLAVGFAMLILDWSRPKPSRVQDADTDEVHDADTDEVHDAETDEAQDEDEAQDAENDSS